MSPRLRRTAIIVFLAVFLGGISGTGAWALWSQSATVTATVQIGQWEVDPEPSPADPTPTEPGAGEPAPSDPIPTEPGEWRVHLNVGCGNGLGASCTATAQDPEDETETLVVNWKATGADWKDIAGYSVRLVGNANAYDSGDRSTDAQQGTAEFVLPQQPGRYTLTIVPLRHDGAAGAATTKCVERSDKSTGSNYRVSAC